MLIIFSFQVFPFVRGWNNVDILNLLFIFPHNVVQNALRNIVSLSKMMLHGIPVGLLRGGVNQ
jgi:hypothetical protein